ncbi:MAG: DUF3108 domain-containing protein [Candidatus Omnitrophota bacterium]|nr:MAG: DUF3108 domain-containing protein [Candidatus Omnitrophota bacterium]
MKLVKRIIIIIVAVILVAFLWGLYTNSLGNVLKSLSLGEGNDKLVFGMNYAGFIPIGKAVIENKGIQKYKGKDVYYIKAEAKLAEILNRFYNVKVQAESFIDKNKKYPLEFNYASQFYGEVKEAKRSFYNQVNHTMTRNGETRMILPNTQDPLSTIYHLMRQDFEVGKTFDLNINTSQKNYRFYAEVLKKKEFEIKNKTYHLYLVKGSVRRRDNSYRHSSAFSIWFMDKPQKVPVLMKTFTNAGLIEGKLLSAN